MTRDEASNILWSASKRHYPGDQMDITAEDIEAFDMAIAALRSPEHDPDTGAMDTMSLRVRALKRFIGIRLKTIPCDNCIGPWLAITHGYTNMKIRDTEVEE